MSQLTSLQRFLQTFFISSRNDQNRLKKVCMIALSPSYKLFKIHCIDCSRFVSSRVTGDITKKPITYVSNVYTKFLHRAIHSPIVPLTGVLYRRTWLHPSSTTWWCSGPPDTPASTLSSTRPGQELRRDSGRTWTLVEKKARQYNLCWNACPILLCQLGCGRKKSG